MDIITHALTGRIIGKLSGRGRVAAVAGVAGAVLPDVDSLVLIFPALGSVIERRGGFHSCAGVLFWAAVVTVACVLTGRYRGSAHMGPASEATREFVEAESTEEVPFLEAPELSAASVHSAAAVPFIAALLGGMSHLLLDVITPWGIPLLWPFGSCSALGITRGFDPWITLLVLIATYFTWSRKESIEMPGTGTAASQGPEGPGVPAGPAGAESPDEAFGGMRERPTEGVGCRERRPGAVAYAGCLLSGYLVLRLVLQASSLSGLSPAESRDASSYALSATNPFRWRLVVRTEDAIDIYRVMVPGAAEKILSFPVERSPCIEESRRGPVASRYLARAKYPYATVATTDRISTVTWRDMRDQLPHIYRSGEVRVRIECGTGKIYGEERTTWLDHFTGGTFFGKPG